MQRPPQASNTGGASPGVFRLIRFLSFLTRRRPREPHARRGIAGGSRYTISGFSKSRYRLRP